ncbi:MAG: hypothetical protein HYZ74_07755 [Elusimicrobia bacterium]|nr:hypothetical protein [Elusimicrobiota bacterium]
MFLGVFYRQGVAVGYTGYVVSRAEDGVVEGEIHGVYFDKTDPKVSGVADAMLAFLQADLDPVVGVRREVLKADYAGRYVWATKGFQFNPDYRFYDVDGQKHSQRDVARSCLARFLKRHRIAPKALTLRGRPVLSLEDLETPADFAELKRANGKTVRITPLVNHELLGAEADLPVGKAFMMGNYLPTDAPYVLSQGGPHFGQKFARDAMPWWNGYRESALK